MQLSSLDASLQNKIIGKQPFFNLEWNGNQKLPIRLGKISHLKKKDKNKINENGYKLKEFEVKKIIFFSFNSYDP